MVEISKADLLGFAHAKRLNIVNSLSGAKQACLIGTKSKAGNTNLAIFNSIMHIGSDPALLGFILRPHQELRRDTFENIKESGVYTINHVHHTILVNAHYTSAKLDVEESEFQKCNLTEEYLHTCEAPFVAESFIKMEMKFVEQLEIKSNNTSLIIGEIQHVYVPNGVMNEKGYLNLDLTKNVVVSGLNRYYSVKHIMDLPYARPKEMPGF